MTRARRESLLSVIIWSLVAVGFVATILPAGGPSTYTEGSMRRVVGAVFIGAAVFGAPLLRYLLRRFAPSEAVDHDERDDRTAAQATNVGMIVVMMTVFLVAIVLWEKYQEAGCVPVGWMWILAYTSFILSHLAPAVAFLLIDQGMIGRGEG